MNADDRMTAIRHLSTAIGHLARNHGAGADHQRATADLQGALEALGFESLTVDENSVTASRAACVRLYTERAGN